MIPVTAETILLEVNDRNAEFRFDSEGIDIAAVFNGVRELVREQNKQRVLVSLAVLVKIFNHTFPRNTILNAAGKSDCVPAIATKNWGAWRSNADFLVRLEQDAPDKIPCAIDALSVGNFSTLPLDQKLSIFSAIDARNLTKDVVKIALKAERPATGQQRPGESGERVLYSDVRTPAGKLLTEVRSSDNYVNIDKVLATAGKTLKDYVVRKENRAFFLSRVVVGGKKVLLDRVNDKAEVVWAHPATAIHAARWAKHPNLEHLLDVLPTGEDIVVDQPGTDDTEAIAKIVTDSYEDIQSDNFSTLRRASDGYVQVSKLAASLGSTWPNISGTTAVTAIINELKAETGKSYADLVIVAASESVWAHAKVAVAVARNRGSGAELEARLEQPFVATVVIQPIKDAQEVVVCTVRSTDGFVNITHLVHSSPKDKTLKDFLRSPHAKRLTSVFELSTPPVTYIVRPLGNGLGTWTHPWLAAVYAEVVGMDVPYFKDIIELHERGQAAQAATQAAELLSQELHSADHIATEPATAEGDHAGETDATQDSDHDSDSQGSDNGLHDDADFRLVEYPSRITFGNQVQGWTIRKVTLNGTKEISCMDLIDAINSRKRASRTLLTQALIDHPELGHLTRNHTFVGRSQKSTPVTGTRGAEVIMHVLRGPNAAAFRLKYKGDLLRILSGHDHDNSVLAADAAESSQVRRDDVFVNSVQVPHNINIMAVADYEKPPCGVYVGMISSTADSFRFKAGGTTYLTGRLKDHRKYFGRMGLVLTIMCGHTKPFDMEDTMEDFYRDFQTPIRVNGKLFTECFTLSRDRAMPFLEAMMAHIMQVHANIITTVRFCNSSVFERVEECEQLKLQQEMTKQNQEVTKQSQEVTKQLSLRLELARMGIQ